jgi:hypothetical protein
MALLELKSHEFSSATSVRILENDQLGLIITGRSDFTHVLITDLKSGVCQGIIIASYVKDIDEVVSAIASDYEVHSTGADFDPINDISLVNRLIESVGIKVVTSSTTSNQSPGSISATPEPFDDQHVLKGLEAEIIKRKTEQIEKGEESGLNHPPP